MYSSTATATTARIAPEAFPLQGVRTVSRSLVVATLVLILLASFGFRARHLSAESLSEDELNKLHAVEDYRAHGLTAANGEHPMLMKALQMASVVAGEHWNATSIAQNYPEVRISTEAALRLPGVIFGALTSLLIFLIASELFGEEVAFIAAALWAIDPAAIGFNRIAKEDTFLLFFFLLANVFWLRGQRVAESGQGKPEPYYWATAVAYGAMVASKYLPHLFAISMSYYYIFQGIPATRWRLGWQRFHWGFFFLIVAATFVVCSPTILLPSTWHEMRVFASEHRLGGHYSYEFMGHLYPNQMTLWLKGLPWYFYLVFIAVKLPLPEIVAFLIGLPLLFRKRLGDGRYFILFWLFYWFVPFSVVGGKYTRYFTVALPAVLITASIGIHALGRLILDRVSRLIGPVNAAGIFARVGLVLVVLGFSAYASVSAAPYYRLYTNILGGGEEDVGSYFPHDEFYDGSVRETSQWIAAHAGKGARVANETPELFTHYLQLAGRDDLISVSLSDPGAMRRLAEGDIIVVARGRRYLTNDALISALEKASQPAAVLSLGSVPATRVYVLDGVSLKAISEVVRD